MDIQWQLPWTGGELQLSSDNDDEDCSQWQKSFAFINWLFAIHERNVNCGGCREEGEDGRREKEGEAGET